MVRYTDRHLGHAMDRATPEQRNAAVGYRFLFSHFRAADTMPIPVP